MYNDDKIPLKAQMILYFKAVYTFLVHQNKRCSKYYICFYLNSSLKRCIKFCPLPFCLREGLLLSVSKQWSLCRGPTCSLISRNAVQNYPWSIGLRQILRVRDLRSWQILVQIYLGGVFKTILHCTFFEVWPAGLEGTIRVCLFKPATSL